MKNLFVIMSGFLLCFYSSYGWCATSTPLVGNVIANQDWMFAPWYGNRPDDKAFLEEDKKRPDAEAAIQADTQGPHESIIRAGEERILS